MPRDFTECVNGGGRVRTQSLSDRFYRAVCYDKAGAHLGEKHKRKSKRMDRRRGG